MNKKVFRDMFGWGFGLWLIGYLLGMVLFMMVPAAMIGWVILPIGTVITLWVLFKKIQTTKFNDYLNLGIAWVLLAIGLDYVFIVIMLKPEDGYYKPDVYLYYLFALVLPIIVGWMKTRSSGE